MSYPDILAALIGLFVFVFLVAGYRYLSVSLDVAQREADAIATRRRAALGRYIGRDGPLGE